MASAESLACRNHRTCAYDRVRREHRTLDSCWRVSRILTAVFRVTDAFLSLGLLLDARSLGSLLLLLCNAHPLLLGQLLGEPTDVAIRFVHRPSPSGSTGAFARDSKAPGGSQPSLRASDVQAETPFLPLPSASSEMLQHDGCQHQTTPGIILAPGSADRDPPARNWVLVEGGV